MGHVPLIGFFAENLRTFPSYRHIQEDIARLMVFSPQSICWQSKRIKGLLLANQRWIRRTLPFPDVIYNRCYSDQRAVLEQIEKIIGDHKIFNVENRLDKWRVYTLLHKSPIGKFLPRTTLLDYGKLSHYLSTNGNKGSLILKPRHGGQGRRIYLIITKQGTFVLRKRDNTVMVESNDISQFITDLRKRIGDSRFVLQEFVPFATLENRVFDIRLLLQKDSQGRWGVSAKLSRVAVEGQFVTNICSQILSADKVLQQAVPNSHQLLAAMTHISLTIACELERTYGLLGEMAVDFGVDKGNFPWVIEVNGKPAKELFTCLKDTKLIKQVYLRPLEYALYLAGQTGGNHDRRFHPNNSARDL